MDDREIAEVFTGITNSDDMQRFFEEILTSKEREALALRWQLLKELNEGETQRSIAARHRISLCKITRGAKLIKDTGSFVYALLNQE